MAATRSETASSFSPAAASRALVETVQRLSQAKELADIVDAVKRAARKITAADGATFVLRDGDQCHYVDEDAVGPLWKGRRFPIDSCISGWAMRHRQPTIVADVFADERIPQAAYRPTFVKSLAMAPIRSLQPIGALGIYWRDAHRPTATAVQWLQSLADSTALAIEHVQAREEMQEVRYRSELLQTENAALRQDRKVATNEAVKICFITRRIEVDGQWLSFESFLKKRYGLEVTHGVSPEAFDRLAGEIDSPTVIPTQ